MNTTEWSSATSRLKEKIGPKEKSTLSGLPGERGSKTRTGENQFVPDRSFNPKMYATAGPRCPVKFFREYLARRPPEMNSEDSPFYLAAITNPASIIWYKKQPLGKNSLGTFMKSMLV